MLSADPLTVWYFYSPYYKALFAVTLTYYGTLKIVVLLLLLLLLLLLKETSLSPVIVVQES